MRRTLNTGILVLAGAAGLAWAAQENSDWGAPEEARALENPVAASPEAIEEGAALYKKNCLMCHGETGKGDGPATQFIKPAPRDITSAEVQERMTDGEIFWKLSEGKKPMPPMKNKLTEEERWKLVHFVRTLQAS